MKKEILYNLRKAIQFLEEREKKDISELKNLSDHSIEDVALHKDLDMVSTTVLIYSIYKVIDCLNEEDYQQILDGLKSAEKTLQQGNLGLYNRHLKNLFKIVQKCNVRVKEHLQDVLQAARIKKGTILFQKGLSIGQAAGLMGLSNWDLQAYVAKTPFLSDHHEAVMASKRLKIALEVFRGKS